MVITLNTSQSYEMLCKYERCKCCSICYANVVESTTEHQKDMRRNRGLEYERYVGEALRQYCRGGRCHIHWCGHKEFGGQAM